MVVCLLGAAVCSAEPKKSVHARVPKVKGDADKVLLAASVGIATAVVTGLLLSTAMDCRQGNSWPVNRLPACMQRLLYSMASSCAHVVPPVTLGLLAGVGTYVLANGAEESEASVEDMRSEQTPSLEDQRQFALIKNAVWSDSETSAAPMSDEQFIANVGKLHQEKIQIEVAAAMLEFFEQTVRQSLEFYKVMGKTDQGAVQALALLQHRIALLREKFSLDPSRLAEERKNFGVEVPSVSAAEPLVPIDAAHSVVK